MIPGRQRAAASPRLPAVLALACAALTAYACLHPFSGWRSTGVGVFDFLAAPWPRYYTGLDLALNVLGFVPLGFFCLAALRPRNRPTLTLVWATLAAALFSFTLESLQNYLPSRVASNIDIACNTLGALLGGLAGLRWAALFDHHGGLARWRVRRMRPGLAGELGLVLIALWWLTQLVPNAPLFASGDLRPLLRLPEPLAFSAPRYLALEAAVVASQILALGLLLWRMLRRPTGALLVSVLMLGLASKSLALSVFLEPGAPGHWATPGALRGLALGGLLLLAALRAPAALQFMLTCVALALGIALVNLLPGNPYLIAGLHRLHPGHALNFHGLTRLAAALWPFLALAYLAAWAPRLSTPGRDAPGASPL